ncbi:MAG: sugar ABC transporter substrate-binding protein [Bacillota bacterium]
MKKLKVICLVVACIFLLSFLSGCGGGTPADDNGGQAGPDQGQEQTPGTGTTGEGKVIGVSSLWTGNDWNLYVSGTIVEALKAKGYSVIHTNAMGDTRQQVADIENLVERRVDGIIIAGGEARAFFDVSARAKSAGIPVIGMEMYLPAAFSNVTVDNFVGGTQTGLYLVNKMGGKGKVIVLDTPGWQTLSIRRNFAVNVLNEFANIKVVGDFEVGTSDPVNLANEIVKGAIRNNPDLTGIITTWGLPSVGAAQAVMEMGLKDQITVVSTDADRPVLEIMEEEGAPKMAVVGMDPRELGQISSGLMHQALTEGLEGIPTVVFGKTYLISNDDWQGDFSKIVPMNPKGMWKQVYFDEDAPF